MKKVLQINRQGTIQATADQATNHQCVKLGHRNYQYLCKIQLTNPSLDDRGFIADHEEINQLIQNAVKGKIPSCELLAETLANTVSEHLIRQDTKHDYVYVRISGTTGQAQAFMEAWAHPEEQDYINAASQEVAKTIKRYFIKSGDEWENGKKYNWNEDMDHLQGHELTEEEYKAIVNNPAKTERFLWSSRFVIDERHIIVKEEVSKLVSHKVDTPFYRFYTLDEAKKLPGIEHAKTGRLRFPHDTLDNYMTEQELITLGGRELTPAEVEKYKKQRTASSYRVFATENGAILVTAWSITDKPLPVKKIRVKTYAQLEADPDVIKDDDDDLLHFDRRVSNGTFYTENMGPKLGGYVLSEEKQKELIEDGTIILRVNGESHTIEKWMTEEFIQ